MASMAIPLNLQTPASLYVGDLHPDVTDGRLFQLFEGVHNLTSVRVCRDTISGRSLGYGYVNFVSELDAIRAMEKMNHASVNGKVIRIMWSHRDSEKRKSGVGNLFVKNLNSSIDNVALNEMFSKYGKVLSCKVALTPDGNSKGFGFVQFESEDSANAAIKNVNASTVGGKQIYVGNFVKKDVRVLSSPDAKYTNLYMKNIDQDLTEEFLKEKFSEFGKFNNLVISKDNNGNSKGFGFVNFDNPDDAKRAMEAMNGTKLGSKVFYVARAQKKAEREQILRRQFEERRKERIEKYKGSNVYVKNIDDDVDDDELRKHFSQCGTITSLKLMRDEKGISKGFGFVCFSTPEEAIKAVGTLHGFMFHRKPLYVAIAQRKEERQAQLQMQFAQRMATLTGHSSAVVPAGYPPLYYTPHPGAVPQIPPRQGLIYHPLGIRPGWRGHGFGSGPRPPFQPMAHTAIANGTRQHRQNRGRVNGHAPPQGGVHSVPIAPHLQQSAQSLNPLKESGNQQLSGPAKNTPNGRPHDMANGSSIPPAGAAAPQGKELLSSMLSAAAPQQQKQILGEHLYPLVEKLQYDLAAKITGMLLEMDNSELLLLLESPDSLATKVEEAVQVLNLSKTRVAGQDKLHSNFLSAEVAVN
ncbi:hypothetical protein Syun_000622 [Stephania yunnanensis]|uniref:Polyadenylate-binding protein n=1 Tax=Stephania yunnanensis TaxID=152371 RepID=A0AAP0LE08_9MAGN